MYESIFSKTHKTYPNTHSVIVGRGSEMELRKKTMKILDEKTTGVRMFKVKSTRSAFKTKVKSKLFLYIKEVHAMHLPDRFVGPRALI